MRRKKTASLAALLAITLITPLLPRCSRGSWVDPAPQWPVYCEIDLNSAIAKPLLSPGGYVRITKPIIAYSSIGLGGILVVRATMEDPSGNQYYAYDLACPVERDAAIQLLVNDRLEAQCPQCGSTYSILYGGGNPIEAKSNVPLTTYTVYRTSNRLVITNR